METILGAERGNACLRARPAALAIVAALMAGTGALGGGTDATPAETPFTIFVGVDLLVPEGKEFHPMQRYLRESVEVLVDGHFKLIPIRKLKNLRVDREPKISRMTATITELRVERAYSTNNDPRNRWASAETGLVGGENEAVDMAVRTLVEAEFQAQAGGGNPSTDETVKQARRDLESVTSTPRSDFSDPAFYEGKIQDELQQELFDAIEVAFRVSADEVLNDCYMVMICDLFEPRAPKIIVRWIYLRHLGAIGPDPRRIWVKNGGFPPGFTLQRHEVHLYLPGRELATNLSEKSVQIAESDAFQFLNLQYIAEHKGETLRPVVAWNNLPAGFAAGLPEELLTQPIWADVDANGVVVSSSASSETRDLVKLIRFHPALEEGKPVPGRVKIILSDYVR
jgi:hypothetical protein